ncbi:MAG: hypothetical protein AAFX09_05045 [Pseudomonadota bacterium]
MRGLTETEINRLKQAGFDEAAIARVSGAAASMRLLPLYRVLGRPAVYFLIFAASYVGAMALLGIMQEPYFPVLAFIALAGGAVLGMWLRWWRASPEAAEAMAARRLARVVVTARSPLINGLADPLTHDAELLRRAHLQGMPGEGLQGLAELRRREAGKNLAAGIAVAAVLSVPATAITMAVLTGDPRRPGAD